MWFARQRIKGRFTDWILQAETPPALSRKSNDTVYVHAFGVRRLAVQTLDGLQLVEVADKDVGNEVDMLIEWTKMELARPHKAD